MNKLEETVVNPNISLNNFEVKIRDQEVKNVQKEVVTKNIVSKKSSTNYKAFLLLVLLTLILIFQITVIL